ncbi:MAG: PHP domain-containing protein [Deltaproteobacteria bacterium]|nr:PHP domain-containing protein [Deltaproteobacteria bacterium]
MLKFKRDKLVTIVEKEDTLAAHGVLDDDIYSLELDIIFSMSDLEILSIKGRWHRWTTPECPRSDQFLQEAIGFKVRDADFKQKVHKIVSRKACRHYANLLLECGHSAAEAIRVIQYKAALAKNPELSFEAFLKDVPDVMPSGIKVTGLADTAAAAPEKEKAVSAAKPADVPVKNDSSEGFYIDLHMHTFPASQCSSAPVDDLIEEAKRIGLNGICLTDHNYVWQADQVEKLRRKHEFLILRGNEITTDQGDVLVFGMEKDIKGIIRLEELRKEAQKVDAFMIVAHPFRGFLIFGAGQVGLTPEKAMQRPLFKLVDGIEIMNGKVTEKENHFAAQVAAGLGLPITGGSDAHEVEEVGKYATCFPGVIRDEKDLLAALKTGTYSPVAFKKRNR